ncbi:hypothetical protein Cfla_3248 [Cellulomonas flavigena DSM 20109]|uniref:Uncharacterized protein n=1 Tax=Cellulomonas flavigena (strain ATCC 482 / DSM 20109 / BCRC 11376 / JCM 18109 / NBRC 3775 / NCIMB 8073 / NRS 134) TaxID=446466 RepID=D5UBX0_CELFN|nr:hypothetical protein [Cellulomonas flavigena]ADG76129.1 hypothetical protein Cfla_3248 [Cellulomonas flavigena DSM 20109]
MSTTSERGTRPAPSRPSGAADPPPAEPGLPVVVLGPVPHGRGTAGLALVVAGVALLLCGGAPRGVVVALAVGAVALAVLSLVTARPRRTGRATAVAAVLVAVVALVVASAVRIGQYEAGELVVAGLSQVDPRRSPEAPEAAPGLVALRSTLQAAPFAPAVVETAAGPVSGRASWYVAVVENATPGYVVPVSAYEVVALRADGTVLDRDLVGELELWPGRTALTGTFDVGDDEVERVEVRGPQPDDGPRTGTPGGLRTGELTARTETTTVVRGAVRSAYGHATDVHVTVVARDAQEQVTGSATVETVPVPARGRAQFEVRFDRVLPPTTRYEVYARP